MRLPAFTKRQQQQEDARMLHERLYDCHLSGQRVILPGTAIGAKRLQSRVSGNYRRFWNTRGYALKTKKLNADELQVWIEPVPSTIHLGKRKAVA